MLASTAAPGPSAGRVQSPGLSSKKEAGQARFSALGSRELLLLVDASARRRADAARENIRKIG